MREPNPRQIALFPELSEHISIPSITSLPEFDRALNALIKMSDLGAFIQLNIQGIDRSYTLNINEINIPADFLNTDTYAAPLSIYLFPLEVRNHLKKLSYGIKSFFNNKNSFRTSFGYFLFRSHFTLWKHYLDEKDKSIQDSIYSELGHGAYAKYFLDLFNKGYKYIKSIADVTAPWEFVEKLSINDIEAKRQDMHEQHQTISSLKTTEIDYPLNLMTIKTRHVPITLKEYVSNIQISSIFKIIHLEYLADKKINSIDDIKELIDSM
ncbi:hypothetical protein ACFL46_03460 [Candidatus Neomarinimicrobiota bacterium]